jgi:hypothetical protein
MLWEAQRPKLVAVFSIAVRGLTPLEVSGENLSLVIGHPSLVIRGGNDK